MQAITTIGLDIAKSVFQVHGVDAAGQVVIRRQLKRRYVLTFFRRVAAMPDRHWGWRPRRIIGRASSRYLAIPCAKVAAIALANKIARIVWAMMAKVERYKEPVALAV
jgi:transposase